MLTLQDSTRESCAEDLIDMIGDTHQETWEDARGKTCSDAGANRLASRRRIIGLR